MGSADTISHLQSNQVTQKKRPKESCKDVFIRQSMQSMFAGNMSVERFLNDVAEFDDNYDQENVELNSLYIFLCIVKRSVVFY